MSSELVTIIVASYNHEKYVIDCLESIKHQDYESIELILSDDCSTDETFGLAKKWCDENRDRFVNVIAYSNETNLGTTSNFNKGLGKATGKYIKPLSSDDMLYPESISDLVDYLTVNPQHDLVYSNIITVDEHARFPIDSDVYKNKLYNRRAPEGKGLVDALYKGNFISAPGVLIKKETYEKFGNYSEKYSFEDYEYWLRVAAKGGSIGYLHKVTAGYRRLSSSVDHFENSAKEKERFNRYIDEHIKLLTEYKPYTTSTMDSFWNVIIPLLIDQGNDEKIEVLLAEKNIRMSIKNKIKLMRYNPTRFGLFKQTKGSH